jgi:hypothetical protein
LWAIALLPESIECVHTLLWRSGKPRLALAAGRLAVMQRKHDDRPVLAICERLTHALIVLQRGDA